MLSRIDISNAPPLKTPAFAAQRLPDEAMVPWALPKGEVLAPLSAAAGTPYAEARVGDEIVKAETAMSRARRNARPPSASDMVTALLSLHPEGVS